MKIAEPAAMVTGVGSGLARAMAIGLASRGARIMAADDARRGQKEIAHKAADQKHSPAT